MQIDDFKVRAGSMKIVYDNGSRFKWVAPQQMDDVLQPSTRPRPPGSKVGHLQKETNSWFGAKYAEPYVELNHGSCSGGQLTRTLRGALCRRAPCVAWACSWWRTKGVCPSDCARRTSAVSSLASKLTARRKHRRGLSYSGSMRGTARSCMITLLRSRRRIMRRKSCSLSCKAG